MTTHTTKRPATTIIILNRRCRARCAAAGLSLLLLAWLVPSPLEALPKTNPICVYTDLC